MIVITSLTSDLILPDGSQRTSTQTAYLDMPYLTDEARLCHIFYDWIGSLLYINLLRDHGYRALYEAARVVILDPKGEIVMTGHHSPVAVCFSH